jgi:hypothetical protein
MIEKKDIQALPFVDGTPDPTTRPDQTRINWIKNGECSDGAQSSIGNEGSLNRAGVSVQKNVVEVQKNVETVKTSLDEVIDQVNKHNEILNQADDLDLIQTVQKHDEEIETLNFAVVQNSERFDEIAKVAHKNTEEIGVVPSHDTAERSVREELEWQKTEMGSYPGFDYNGKPNLDSRGSGMKSRIINNSMAISDHNARLNEIENNWQTSDIGSLTREVQSIRSEVGPKDQKVPGHHIYDRLKKVENVASAGQTDVQSLNKHTGIASFPRGSTLTLIDLVDSQSGDLTKLANTIRATDSRLVIVEQQIGDANESGTILYNQKVVMKDVSDLHDIVGKSNSEGLRYSVAVLETEIGSDSTPGTVKNRILLTEQGIRDLNLHIDEINDILGVNSNSAGSFSDRVTELELQMNGDVNGHDDFEKQGVYPYLAELYNNKPVIDTEDDKYYIRTKDSWVEIGTTDIDMRDSVLKINGENFAKWNNSEIEIGEQGTSLSVKGQVKDLTFVNTIKMMFVDSQEEILREFVNHDKSSGQETLTIGDANIVTNVIGQTVLVNGEDLSKNSIPDVFDDGIYMRRKGDWVDTEQTLQFKHIVTHDGTNVFDYQDGKSDDENTRSVSLTFGSDDIPTIIKGVSEIHTKNLRIESDTDVIFEVGADKINIVDKPVYVGSNRVLTEADDAPNDNDYYARYKGTWAKINASGGGSGGGIEDVPNNTLQYVRSGQKWSVLGEVPIEMKSDIALQWETQSNNFTGLMYNKTSNKLSLGGSGAKVDILSDVTTLNIDSDVSINQRSGSGLSTLIMTDSDKNIFIGDRDNHKELVLRSMEDPSVQTVDGKFKIWHSGNDAVEDGQIYGRKNGEWVVFSVNRTQDVILNNGYSFKVVDSNNKLMSVATSGANNLIELGQADALMNIRSTVRLLNLDDKVRLTSTEGSSKINLIGKSDDLITISDVSKKVRIDGSELRFNDKRVITEADDAPADGFKYVRQDKKWSKAYDYGSNAPSSTGAKEGDIYFQYM